MDQLSKIQTIIINYIKNRYIDVKEYASYGQFVQTELNHLKDGTDIFTDIFLDVKIKEIIEDAIFIVAEVMESVEPFDIEIIMEYKGEKYSFIIYKFEISDNEMCVNQIFD